MSQKIFRIFNPGGPKENPTDKRRAQLRNAQRSYRDRKDKYTKALEQEISKMRANEAELAARCEQLSDTVWALANMLAQHGLSIPPGIKINSKSNTIETQRNKGHLSGNRLSVAQPSALNTIKLPSDTARTGCTQTPPAENDLPYQTWGMSSDHESRVQLHRRLTENSRPSSRSWSRTNEGPVGFHSSAGRMSELDPILAGMEFVLTVERPCLEHIGGNPSEPAEPTGHALTTSAQLLFAHCHSPKEDPLTLPYWNAPADLLHRLLNLSADLCLEGELTPTQAWDYIRNQPQFGGIEVQRLQDLAEKLRSSVKCHGFGAVIDTQTFQDLIFEVLMCARDF
ncbi:Putative basic-leucine zipper domain-containing protein [Colletotrichum destructivum]|uniref:Basic-leucine zipper domain-containing protein n=1 Tax=Colletotrichum destructivum TaxID=34406 RepID=A0AAX4I1B0_9PEZI|nr:Putative basic-leucine zipper domain-containing protein [Colletotrichum destructivum]